MKTNLFLIIFILFVGCTVNKHATSSVRQTDSLHQTSRLSIQTSHIPATRAQLSIPAASLKSLPAGAAYIKKSGQATAEIRYLHDTLFVTASCDSLQNLVYMYESALAKHSEQTKAVYKQTDKTSRPYYAVVFFFIVILLLLLCFFKNLKRRFM